jgi:hypothetical protein
VSPWPTGPKVTLVSNPTPYAFRLAREVNREVHVGKLPFLRRPASRDAVRRIDQQGEVSEVGRGFSVDGVQGRRYPRRRAARTVDRTRVERCDVVTWPHIPALARLRGGRFERRARRAGAAHAGTVPATRQAASGRRGHRGVHRSDRSGGDGASVRGARQRRPHAQGQRDRPNASSRKAPRSTRSSNCAGCSACPTTSCASVPPTWTPSRHS